MTSLWISTDVQQNGALVRDNSVITILTGDDPRLEGLGLIIQSQTKESRMDCIRRH